MEKKSIHVSDSILEELANDLMENYPEYSINLHCINYDYKNGRFSFYDEDTDEKHMVTTKDVSESLPGFIDLILSGDLHFYGLDKTGIFDAGNWDAIAVDALVQFTIFGEVIYG